MRHSEILLKTCFVEQLAHNNWQGCPKLRGQCGHEVEPNSMQLRRSCWPHTVWKSVTEATFLDPKYSQNPISLVGGTRCNLFLLFVCVHVVFRGVASMALIMSADYVRQDRSEGSSRMDYFIPGCDGTGARPRMRVVCVAWAFQLKGRYAEKLELSKIANNECESQSLGNWKK